MGKSTISMAIFNSYVKLPKGKFIASTFSQVYSIDSNNHNHNHNILLLPHGDPNIRQVTRVCEGHRSGAPMRRAHMVRLPVPDERRLLYRFDDPKRCRDMKFNILWQKRICNTYIYRYLQNHCWLKTCSS